MNILRTNTSFLSNVKNLLTASELSIVEKKFDVLMEVVKGQEEILSSKLWPSYLSEEAIASYKQKAIKNVDELYALYCRRINLLNGDENKV